MKEKKIYHIINSDGKGGAEVFLNSLVTYSDSRFNLLYLWKFNDNIFFKVLSIFSNIISLRGMIKLQKEPITILHTHLIGADILISLCVFFRIFPKKVELYTTLHSDYNHHYCQQGVRKAIGALHFFLLKFFFSKVVCVGQCHLPAFKECFGLKVICIENGIAKPILKKQTTIPNSIAMMGNIKKHKGYEKLPLLSKLLDKKYTINIAGKVYDQSLYESIKANCAENVIFHGFIEDTNTFLSKYDFFISLSSYEGLPISVLEAAFVKKKIFLSNIPAHAQLLPHISKDLVLFDTPQELATKIPQKYDPQLVEVMYQHVLNNYTIEENYKNYLNIYKEN